MNANARRFTRCFIASTAFSLASIAQQPSPVDQTVDISQWKTFANRAGWSIKHPNSLEISSCRSCSDPTDPNTFVAFYDPATKELIFRVERLRDKPPDQNVEQWLDDVKKATVLNPLVSEEWIFLNGERALKAINRNPDSTESEHIYVVHGSKTFAIRADRSTPFYPVYQRMLATFRFTTP
jgi:hypothetical protein